MELNKEKIGDYLASLRKAKSLSQQEIADLFYVSNKTISKWETGTSLPETSMLLALAEFYDVTIDDILKGGKDNKSIKEESKIQNQEVRWKTIIDNQTKFLKIICLSSLGLLIFGLVLGIVIGYANTNGFVTAGVSLSFIVIASFIVIISFVYKTTTNESIKDKLFEYSKKYIYTLIFVGAFDLIISLVFFFVAESSYIRPSIITFNSFLFISFGVLLGLLIIYGIVRLGKTKIIKCIHFITQKKIVFFSLLTVFLLFQLLIPYVNASYMERVSGEYITYHNEVNMVEGLSYADGMNLTFFIVLILFFIGTIILEIINIVKKKKSIIPEIFGIIFTVLFSLFAYYVLDNVYRVLDNNYYNVQYSLYNNNPMLYISVIFTILLIMNLILTIVFNKQDLKKDITE